MIATKTTTLMVAMAVMGIVPVAAHAQSAVDIEEIAQAVAILESANTAGNEQGAANVDSDTNTGTNAVFATVGAGGTFDSTNSNTVNDDDTQTNGLTGTATAASEQSSTQNLTATQQPTLTVADVLALLPGGG
jgi:hypothetical protein